MLALFFYLLVVVCSAFTVSSVLFCWYRKNKADKKTETGDGIYTVPEGGIYKYQCKFYETGDMQNPVAPVSVPVPVAVPSEGSFTVYRPNTGDQWPLKLNVQDFKAAVEYSESQNKNKKKKSSTKKKKKTKGKSK